MCGLELLRLRRHNKREVKRVAPEAMGPPWKRTKSSSRVSEGISGQVASDLPMASGIYPDVGLISLLNPGGPLGNPPAPFCRRPPVPSRVRWTVIHDQVKAQALSQEIDTLLAKETQATADTRTLLNHIDLLGLRVNWQKSNLIPSQQVTFLGMAKQNQRYDSRQVRDLIQFYYPDKKETKPENKQKGKESSEDKSSSEPSTSGQSSAEGGKKDGGCEAVRRWSREGGSSCCQLDDLKTLSKCDMRLGNLSFSRSHTVLIDVKVFHQGQVVPQRGRDVWHSNFVKMPCSMSSMSPKPDMSLFGRIPNSSSHLENHFSTLFSKIAALALKLPKQVEKTIPLLQRHQPATITLSQFQIACLLANAFYCTFPHRNTTKPDSEYHNYPSINFSRLFGDWSERKNQKLMAIMEYFNVVTDDKFRHDGLVTFERRCLRDADVPDWRGCRETLGKLHVTSEGTIEDEGTGLLQVDFAAKWIGGGVLDTGLVQEEILFLMHPELIVSRLFTEKLDDKECLIITGTQRFSCCDGLSDRFQWMGPFHDKLERDDWKRLKRQILAIDALHFRHPKEQYSMDKVRRELNKAYCGFKGQPGREEPDIATGKWGCGAFNGDAELKAVIQLMAAAKARRGLVFFTFKDDYLTKRLQQIYHSLVSQKATVGQLYKHLEIYCSLQRKQGTSHEGLFDYLGKIKLPVNSSL
ncbi:PREDICTED: poly(ADP-ribose) glycohydrolase-like [Cyprinodon variegatus]|uniref:poly(ADP-ribose) glycohydrolase-like n=1 Tax=Cyprinodon variegatus TaxID=28743 RepID=UPI0007428927|nr:PREDICTED: poly(ADP-ribose) glycohydrolase-like [Cyprinodon variegatus]